MNATVKQGGVITLPTDVIETLKLEVGSEVSFRQGADGAVVLAKIPEGTPPTREQIRERIRNVANAARSGLSREFANMTTDEFMEFIRGD